METDFEYYQIGAKYIDGLPLLRENTDVEDNSAVYLSLNQEAPEEGETVWTVFNPPMPRKANLNADAFSYDGCASIFSKKIFEAINPLKFNNVQFIPTVITDNKGEDHTGFYALNICQELAVFDEEKSEYDSIEEDESWMLPEKIVLDREKLATIPLEDRLVFVAKEDSQFRLYHKSVVDAIMACNPINIGFGNIENWRG